MDANRPPTPPSPGQASLTPEAQQQAQPVQAQLQHLQLPKAVAGWPLAPGWWASGLMVLVIITALVTALLRHRRRQRYRVEALAELARLEQSLSPDPAFLAAINSLLKRVCIHCYGRETVAALSGQSWIDLLRRQAKHHRIDDEVALALSEGLYRPDLGIDRHRITAAVRHWIKHHGRVLNA